MSGVGLLVAGAAAAVAAGASAAAAEQKRKANSKAAGAQKTALTGQAKILEEELSYSKVNQESIKAERARAKERIRLQEEIDPELANLRKLGKEQLLEQARRPEASQQSVQIAKQLFGEFQKPDAGLERLKDQIISKAQEDLAAGATLPPEFQAELVRAGISTGAQAGLKPVRSTVGGNITQALGAAGVNLAAQRTAEAQSLTQTANDLSTSRARLLTAIFPTISTSETNQRLAAAANFGIGESTLPGGGLTGAEAAQLQINKGNTLLNLRGKRGAIDAQRELAQGEARAANYEAAGQFASSIGGLTSSYYGAGGAGGNGSGISPASQRRAQALLS